MSNPNEDDPWPRYAIFSEALKLDHRAACIYGVEKIPTLEWSLEQVLLVALETLRFGETRRQ